MQIGLGLWLGTRQVGGFNPAAVLFGAGEQGGWYDPSDISTLFQDTAGTTPVTAAGQTVARINDKSGRGNHLTQATAASRPQYQIDALGLPFLLFDGTDDWFVSPTITPGIDKAQVFAGVRKLSDAASGILLEMSSSTGANSGVFNFFAPSGAAPSYSFASKGTTLSTALVSTGYASPITNVLVGIGDIAGDSTTLRVNSTQVAQNTADQGTGNYLAYPLYVGRRGGTSLPFNGRLYQMIVRFGANLPTGTIDATESFVSAKTGVGPSLGYSLLSDFESLTGFSPSSAVAISLAGSGRQALNTYGMRVVGNGTNSSVSVSGIFTTTVDVSSWDRIAFAVDIQQSSETSELITFRPRFTVGSDQYTYQFNTGAGLSAPLHAPWYARGKRWISLPVDDLKLANFSGASIKSVPAGTSKRFDMTANLLLNNYNVDMVIDALVLPAPHRPTIVFTFDDINSSQYTDVFPLMQAKGWAGTLYVPAALVNTGGKLTTAQIAEMRAAGWSCAIDSMDNDDPLTLYPTLAECITNLNVNRSAVLSAFGDTAGAKHLCYSYGAHGYPQAPVTFSAVCNGTDVVDVGPATNAFASLSNGMRVFGATLPATGLSVVKPLTGTTVQLSATVAAGTRNLTFVGNVPNLAVTCNGTTTVTMASTANLWAGLEMMGFSVPANTTIVSVDTATQITVSAAVPSTCVRASFGYTSGEFWPSKVADALIAAGYQSARHVNGNQHIFSGWGLPPLATVGIFALSVDDTAQRAVQLAQIEQAFRSGSDIILYSHNQTTAEFSTFLDNIETLVTTYNARVSSVGEWGGRIEAATNIQP